MIRWFRSLFCEHRLVWSNNIYGDMINLASGNRSEWVCEKCGALKLKPYLGGPEYMFKPFVDALKDNPLKNSEEI